MSLMGRIIHALHGARKLEFLLVAALVAAVALLITGNDNFSSVSETGTEVRLQDVLSCIEGVGRVRVAVNEDDEGDVLGVLIVAEGVSRLETYLSIQQAVHTFVGTDISRIEIIEMGDGK